MKQLYSTLFCSLVLLCVACSPKEQKQTSAALPQSPDELYGELFHDVQMARVFPDSKTFADCTPKIAPSEIVANYAEFKHTNEKPDLKAFVNQYFDAPKPYMGAYKTDTTQTVVEHINALWDVLKRDADTPVNGSSLLPLPSPYIVPGGRFREIYYWDSYFTMLGLQVSGRTETIEHMVDNFSYLINTYGFIPNGSRAYYLTRSQPPFFSLMVGVLAEQKGEATYVKYLPALEKEYAYWMKGENELSAAYHNDINACIKGPNGELLNRYWDYGTKPRPEGYVEDYELANKVKSTNPLIYSDLRAGACSGWDYSSRWFANGKDIATIQTTKIIPVDLNCLLYALEKAIEKGYTIKGDANAASNYMRKAEQRKMSIQNTFWDAKKGFFCDYNTQTHQLNPQLSLAGLYPLFFGLATPTQATSVARIVEKDFLKANGVSTTLAHTGQQWDAPNGWAPLQWITIQGLRNYKHDALANDIKKRWININIKVYKATGKMMEKYNVEEKNLLAGGGEYANQDGFGWTNGVLLRLLSEK